MSLLLLPAEWDFTTDTTDKTSSVIGICVIHSLCVCCVTNDGQSTPLHTTRQTRKSEKIGRFTYSGRNNNGAAGRIFVIRFISCVRYVRLQSCYSAPTGISCRDHKMSILAVHTHTRAQPEHQTPSHQPHIHIRIQCFYVLKFEWNDRAEIMNCLRMRIRSKSRYHTLCSYLKLVTESHSRAVGIYGVLSYIEIRLQ